MVVPDNLTQGPLPMPVRPPAPDAPVPPDPVRKLPPAPPLPPPEQQLEQWLAFKRKEYETFGATPEQIDKWQGYNRTRYQKFIADDPQRKASAARAKGPK